MSEGDLESLLDDASGHLAVGELDEAFTCYDQCTRLNPNHFESWHAKGMTLMKLGRFEEAIEAGLKTVDLNPNEQLAWSSLSLFYVRAGKIQEAEAAGAKARILSWGGKLRKDTPPQPEP
jgi:tetratricopeptide (TPR) repeat protein